MAFTLTDTEKSTLLSWLPYAQSWGYDTPRRDDEIDFELRLHGLNTHYAALSAVSDLVFRNIIRLHQHVKLVYGDVWTKALQTRWTITGLRELMDPDGDAYELVTDYFMENEDFEEEIKYMHILESHSPVFKLIAHAAKVLRGIVYDTEAVVMEHLESIAGLVEENS